MATIRPTTSSGREPERAGTPAGEASASRETVTACLIVMNESERIGDALASVSFCDEVVVVDGGSADATPQLAEAAGARVVRSPWPGYAQQRNIAIDAARSEWILEIDADERVSPELKEEIDSFLAAPPPELDMAVIPLRDIFLGKDLGPSSKYPMYRGRLFRRLAYSHDERRAVHEGLWPHGAVEPLSHDLRHILASTWREAIHDSVRYARLQARHRPRPGVASLVLSVVVRPPAKMAYRAVVLGGWRDGRLGIGRIGVECLSDALSCVYARGESQHGLQDVHAPPHVGPLRVVGVAASAAGVQRGAMWLAEAATSGADVALLAPKRDRSLPVRARWLDGFGLFRVVRGIDAEAQIRPIDAIVPFDTLSAIVAGFVPRSLRGVVCRLGPNTRPPEVLRALEAETRSLSSAAPTASIA